MLKLNDVNPSWRKYQDALKKRDTCRRRAYAFFKLFALLTLAAILCFLLVRFIPILVKASFPEKPDAELPRPEPYEISRAKLASLLQPGLFHQTAGTEFDLSSDDGPMRVRTTINPSFQKYMMDITSRNHAHAMAFVALDPKDGRILAMTGFDAGDPARNPCVETLFPAASVFKIVAAAAAVEEFGFHEQTTFKFHGGKYTLYRSQIVKTHPHAVPISFADAFGESVNPVFGQLGALYLKKERMDTHAEKFGFNRPLPFDTPTAVSEFDVTDDAFHLAEIASGFNRTTRITPLHGAMLAALAVNDGVWSAPYLVASVTDGTGRTIYTHAPEEQPVVKKRTAHILHKMMAATIHSGTCKRTFRGYTRDPVLSRLHIGGKTGSICGNTCDTRFDWCVGFARVKQGGETIVVAAVVAHDKLIGKRSMAYVKDAMRFYFQNIQPSDP